MIPVAPDVEVWCEAPTISIVAAPEDVWSSDGIGGGFRDTWCMAGITIEDAQEVLATDDDLIARANAAAHDPVEFDKICQRLEWADNESDDDLPHFEPPGIDGLDMGVAGLVFALNALGMPTVASCRGHPDGWSGNPIVHFVAELPWAHLVYEVTRTTACGFIAEHSFFTVWGRTVADTHHLAQALLDSATSFQAIGVPFHERPEMFGDPDDVPDFLRDK